MEGRDPLMTELEAMALISRVLGTLPDIAARQRVLRWAAERTGVDAVAFSAAVQTTAAAVRVADDPTLKVDALEDMFAAAPALADDDLTVPVDEPLRAATPEASKPVADILRSFAAEFQRFAEEWNGAAA
jgi:hypothetical protein